MYCIYDFVKNLSTAYPKKKKFSCHEIKNLSNDYISFLMKNLDFPQCSFKVMKEAETLTR